VIKDIEDLPGDLQEGIHTLPSTIGVRRAWFIALVALLAGAIISPLPYLEGTFDEWYFLGLVPALIVLGYGGAIAVHRAGVGQRLLKVGMYLALFAFILGRVEIPL